MKILFVTPSFPYPPNDGGRLGYYNPIKYLSRSNEIVLVSFGAPENASDVSALERFCVAVEIFQGRSKRGLWALGGGLIFNPPGSLAKYWNPGFGDFLQQCVGRHNPDLVELQHLSMAVYGRYFPPSLPVLLREHNVEYKVWERQAHSARSWPEWTYVRLAAPRVRRYEGHVASRFARCITVSAADAKHLSSISPQARVEVIPSGVDTEYFEPARCPSEEPWSLTLTGSFEWPPKQHSLWVLLTEIFPRIKSKVAEAKLYIVGKGVPRKIRDAARQIPGVVVTGLVDDVRPFLARTSVVLQYLESGGGIALKVLEAMAMRKPVLSNRLGCEGIDVEGGRHYLLADGIQGFAAAAVNLLNDCELRTRLADEGWKRVQEAYAWQQLVGQFEKCYAEVLSEVAGKAGEPAASSLDAKMAALTGNAATD